jgi:glucokinase
MLLVGDIGGTNTRIAVLPEGPGRPVLETKVPSREHPTFNSALSAALEGRTFRFRAACFGIAGPVVNNRCTATNLPWRVDGAALGRAFRIPRVRLVNDLVALAYGAVNAPRRALRALNGAALPRKTGANLAILAAGTGLGEAALVWDDTTGRHVPLGTEGSHGDYAPRDALETELRDFLIARHGRVSTERVVSGPGLAALYEFFRDVKKLPRGEPPLAGADLSAEVTRLALSGSSPAARAAVDLFVRAYGAEAGNVALRYFTAGGLYVAGNIAVVLAERLQSAAFRDAFVSKGRFSTVLEAMPVALVMDSNVGIHGAAVLARALSKERS